jgi:hypothetical protein
LLHQGLQQELPPTLLQQKLKDLQMATGLAQLLPPGIEAMAGDEQSCGSPAQVGNGPAAESGEILVVRQHRNSHLAPVGGDAGNTLQHLEVAHLKIGNSILSTGLFTILSTGLFTGLFKAPCLGLW